MSQGASFALVFEKKRLQKWEKTQKLPTVRILRVRKMIKYS